MATEYVFISDRHMGGDARLRGGMLAFLADLDGGRARKPVPRDEAGDSRAVDPDHAAETHGGSGSS